jgi:hypothetical protein
LAFEVDGERLSFGIIEYLAAHELTKDEAARAATGYRWGIPKYDYAPGGRLQVVLHHEGSRLKTWADTEKRQLDNRLGRIVVTAEHLAQRLKEERAEAARRRAAAMEAERLKREREERARHQQFLRDDLHQMTQRGESAERLRAFLRAVLQALPEPQRDRDLQAWLAWAAEYVDSIDPLARPESIAKSTVPRATTAVEPGPPTAP